MFDKLNIYLEKKTMEQAACSCVFLENSDHPECCVCFGKLCRGGTTHSDICPDCVKKLPKTNGVVLHPLKQTPLKMCICGKVWNTECSMSSLFKSTRIFDTSKLTDSPAQNMLLLKDPNNYYEDIAHAPMYFFSSQILVKMD
jgi:hypothetical protein